MIHVAPYFPPRHGYAVYAFAYVDALIVASLVLALASYATRIAHPRRGRERVSGSSGPFRRQPRSSSRTAAGDISAKGFDS